MNYPYASGNIKALETKVLDRNKLFVLVKYERSEFVKVLSTMNYGDKGTTVEELIVEEMAKVKKTIDELSPAKDVTDLFYLLYDAQNIKILYKIKNFNLNSYDLLVDNGSINPEDLTKAIMNDDYTNLSKTSIGLIKHLNKELIGINNPKILSFMIDREIYKYAMNKTKNKVLHTYLVNKIDCTNIISMIRCQNLKWDFSEFELIYLDGGTINKDIYKDIYMQDAKVICKKLSVYYNEEISKILKIVFNDESIEKLEIEFDKLILNNMSKEKDDFSDCGPMIFYYLLKKAEAQNIRLLYSKDKIEIKDLL